MRSIKAWLQLIRLPNLLTAPGDPLAGFALAQLPYSVCPIKVALPPVAASLLLYAAGLISNDYFDLAEDSLERRDRPLPSKLIAPSIAIGVAVLLGALGIAVASLAGRATAIVAAILAAAIFSYNVGTKRNLLIGPINMGACRGLSLLMGASVFGQAGLWRALVILAAMGLALYVAGITRIASRETHRVEIGQNRWRPLVSLTTCFATMAFYILTVYPPFAYPTPLSAIVSIALAGSAAAWAWRNGKLLAGAPEYAVVAGAVGKFLRGLLLVQAAFCALGGESGLVVALALVLLWPVSMFLGRWFYSS